MNKIDERLANLSEKLARMSDKAAYASIEAKAAREEHEEAVEAKREERAEKREDKIATVKGDVAAFQENVRIHEEEEKNKQKPWVEGVVAARGMSIGDVFNNMRGMNGAKVRDPNLDANQKTAENTEEMKNALNNLNRTLRGEGVK